MADLAGVAVLTIVLTGLGAYLLGSIPFGLIITRLGGAGDVREIGSGNIGATNVLRTGRKELALATLLLDAGKGAVAVLIARQLFDNDALTALAGASAFLGHLFPIWLGFRGGKGVATFYGVLVAVAWPVGLVAAAVWIFVFALTRISSLSALVAAGLAVPVAWLLGQSMPTLLLTAFMAGLVILRHHENIGRLLRGQEPRFGSGR
ncbi:MAG: glycerol-3-phosphate 1-O-acyltransferase PlsY [Caulobacterales bacterium]|nr:glycerol-3-phosphate 1-O-acyltransferase PlsY [Caulobacterales bacterium]